MKRFAIFAAASAAPIAFVYCTKPSETPSVTDASIVADPAAASSSAGVSAPATPATIATSATASASSSAPSKRRTCEALQQNVTNLIASNRACKADAECDNVMTGCGLDGQCGVGITKTGKPLVESASKLFFAKSCLDVLPPQPCATCAMPPPPSCKSGRCD